MDKHTVDLRCGWLGDPGDKCLKGSLAVDHALKPVESDANCIQFIAVYPTGMETRILPNFLIQELIFYFYRGKERLSSSNQVIQVVSERCRIQAQTYVIPSSVIFLLYVNLLFRKGQILQMLIPVPLLEMVLKIELLRETFLVLGLQFQCEKCSEQKEFYRINLQVLRQRSMSWDVACTDSFLIWHKSVPISFKESSTV